jgi:hypothetical protein
MFWNLLLQNHWAKTSQTWYKLSLLKGIQIKGHVLFKGEIITKNVKMGVVI